MKNQNNTLTFKPREFKGSRLRCLQITSQPAGKVRAFFNELVGEHAEIRDNDIWMPSGFLGPDESQLVEESALLTPSQREELKYWWLKGSSSGRIPNWDLVSTCKIMGERGLLLVEAKSHEGEFKGKDDTTKAAETPAKFIREALKEATEALNQFHPGFDLSASSHYQLSNRIAFAWRLASQGVPVVLVYLGFLDAEEMSGNNRVLLRSGDQWEHCVKERGATRVPREAWGRTFLGGKLTFLIRSARVSISSEIVTMRT